MIEEKFKNINVSIAYLCTNFKMINILISGPLTT